MMQGTKSLPYDVRVINCPVASLERTPCKTLADAEARARWVASFLLRTQGSKHNYVIEIHHEGVDPATDLVVQSRATNEWLGTV
jgi:hypothetical protein